MSERENNHIKACVETKHCHCGEPLSFADQHNGAAWEKVAHCLSCYDGAPDAGRLAQCVGRGADEHEAAKAWADSVDPWPDLAECCVCEQTVTEANVAGHAHHGFGYPICGGCMETGEGTGAV